MGYQGREIEIACPFVKLAGREWGREDGKKVLGLHGWLDNAASFDGLAPYLGDDVHFVALDWAGHGRSAHRPGGDGYHFVDWVTELFDAADVLGWERFSVIGHSMGAGAATLAAGAFPERFEKLVLLEGIGPLSTAPQEAPAQLRRSLSQRQVLATREHSTYPSLDAAVKRRLEGLPLTEASARTLVARGVEEVEGGVRFRFAPMLRVTSPLRLSEDHVLAFLAEIACPTLFVRGLESFLVEMAHIEKRIAQVSDIQVLDVPGKHHVHLDHPERIAQAIVDFLAT